MSILVQSGFEFLDAIGQDGGVIARERIEVLALGLRQPECCLQGLGVSVPELFAADPQGFEVVGAGGVVVADVGEADCEVVVRLGDQRMVASDELGALSEGVTVLLNGGGGVAFAVEPDAASLGQLGTKLSVSHCAAGPLGGEALDPRIKSGGLGRLA